jgi:hypothetical protein
MNEIAIFYKIGYADNENDSQKTVSAQFFVISNFFIIYMNLHITYYAVWKMDVI